MTKISNTRKILGLTVLVGTVFFLFNGIQGVAIGGNIQGLLVTFVITLGGYFVGNVVLLKNPFVPDFLKRWFENSRKAVNFD